MILYVQNCTISIQIIAKCMANTIKFISYSYFEYFKIPLICVSLESINIFLFKVLEQSAIFVKNRFQYSSSLISTLILTRGPFLKNLRCNPRRNSMLI